MRAFALLVVTAFAALVPACKPAADDLGVLERADFEVPEGVPAFNGNLVLNTPDLIDDVSLDVAAVQRFLHRTPYDRPSFLETYQSNGVGAADAIVRASVAYHINPLVFLVHAQAREGLVGATSYPFPTERVEYVFGCGCLKANDCVPELAGFDRQVDCLGRRLRVALDQIRTNAETAAGWGKDKTTLTLDNVRVTPASEATAAIYDLIPRVAREKAGGTWLFWNLWNVDARTIGYTGAFDPDAPLEPDPAVVPP